MAVCSSRNDRIHRSPSYCLSSNSSIKSNLSGLSTSSLIPSSGYRAFNLIPEQILRYILTFLNARELSSQCVFVSKRFSNDSRRAAKTVLDVLSEKYKWIRLLLLERKQLSEECSLSVENKGGNIESNITLKSKSFLTSNSNTNQNNNQTNYQNQNQYQNQNSDINSYERIQIEKNIRNNIYILHILTSPSIISVGGNFEPKRVDSYDVVCNKWIELSETKIGREVFFEVLWYQGFVYVFCGIHHSSYGSVERLNPLTNTWSKVSSLPGLLFSIF
jgi:Kelch motif